MLIKLKRYPKTIVAWIFVSLMIMLTHIILARPLAHDFTAVLLAIIATIYIGFALQDGLMIQEIVAASLFILMALLGLWVSPYFWVLGLVLHGLWDWLHHPKGIQTKVPDYYPPVCVVVDGLLAVFLLLWI
jgi:hypothetical protein